ncbi:hypothetical protein AIOL_004400 [Candidatus Rhodobacter oscarellae]|uniref:Anti-sigma K factor RskA C-terminal domain-containing protein n=1 Tax=Candidatus Rhodobacter oscarellae TaxID=1675527 RepID=A0A0J9H0Z7_9RHOB|nr:anti-sigma factor [Candidatus Rhodobacter lobularis]KMW59418.1 hypothetical protein AIOL_004400 [Candidatus Rhodobacter lobularis]
MTEFDPSDQSDNTIAAEYVVGVLPLEGRRKAETRMRRDTSFAALIARWQDHLSGFNSDYGSMTPSRRIKAKIDRKLFAKAGRWGRFLPPLLSAVTAALLVALFLVNWGFDPSAPDLRARLASPETPYQFILELRREEAEAQITLAAGDLPAEDRSFELWLLPNGAAPVSLGVFAPGGVFALPDTQQVAAGATLAVSLEPVGGSPTGAPTGPVIAIGILSDA